ncbi:MAG: hypothetical protein RLZ75_136 [Pseudomonadota bacterium]|jgi:hypothetical protein
MSHPFDLDSLPFEPSKNTRIWWTRVRKEPVTTGGINLSGLFRIDKFTMDSIWFFGVLICEIIGLSSIASELDSFKATLTIVLIGIIIDLGLAIAHHWRVGANCVNKNKIIIADFLAEDMLRAENQAITPAAVQQRSMALKDQCTAQITSNIRIARWLIAPLIWVFAIAKIAAFFILSDIEFDSTTVLIILTYLVAGYIHIFHTGYFLAALGCYIFMNSEIKQFTHNTLPQTSRIQPAGEPNHRDLLLTDAQLPIEVTDINTRHVIKLIPSEQYDALKQAGELNNEQIQALQQGKKLYSFRTHGILSDQALQCFANKATNATAIQAILLKGLYIQTKML